MNPQACSLSIIIPAYNEAARLGPTICAYLGAVASVARPAELLVVDDGSTDATHAAATAAAGGDERLQVIRLPQNHGKGYAVRTGVANARGARILFADADGSTPISELARLWRALDAGADVAIGSRQLPSADVAVESRATRRLAGRLFHQVARYAGVRGVVDTQCGFKLFTAAAAADIFPRLRLTGYAFDVELLLAAQHRGYRVDEVPVNWSHQAGSKVNVFRDGLVMARDVARLRAYAWRGTYTRTMPPRAAALTG
jgi:dolichyl-phosphate beta-glucosyltransferase